MGSRLCAAEAAKSANPDLAAFMEKHKVPGLSYAIAKVGTPNADWKTVSGIAISGGKPVRVEWRFTGEGDGTYLGAYIDDVVVTVP